MRRCTKHTLNSTCFFVVLFLFFGNNKAQSHTASLPVWGCSLEYLKVVRNQEHGFIFQPESISSSFFFVVGILKKG